MTDPGGDSPFGLSLMREPGDDPRRRLRAAPLSSLFEIGFRILRRHWVVLLGLSFLLGLRLPCSAPPRPCPWARRWCA